MRIPISSLYAKVCERNNILFLSKLPFVIGKLSSYNLENWIFCLLLFFLPFFPCILFLSSKLESRSFTAPLIKLKNLLNICTPVSKVSEAPISNYTRRQLHYLNIMACGSRFVLCLWRQKKKKILFTYNLYNSGISVFGFVQIILTRT